MLSPNAAPGQGSVAAEHFKALQLRKAIRKIRENRYLGPSPGNRGATPGGPRLGFLLAARYAIRCSRTGEPPRVCRRPRRRLDRSLEAGQQITAHGYDLLSRRTSLLYANLITMNWAWRLNDTVEGVIHSFAAGAGVTFGYAYNRENAVAARALSDPAYLPGAGARHAGLSGERDVPVHERRGHDLQLRRLLRASTPPLTQGPESAPPAFDPSPTGA